MSTVHTDRSVRIELIRMLGIRGLHGTATGGDWGKVWVSMGGQRSGVGSECDKTRSRGQWAFWLGMGGADPAQTSRETSSKRTVSTRPRSVSLSSGTTES